MEIVEATGSFWLPGSDGAAVYGSLKFSPSEGTNLALLDGLGELGPGGEGTELLGGMRDRIFGRIRRGGHKVDVTLVDCIWLSPTEYYANRLLIGGHFPVDDTAFDEAIIRLQDLPAWVGQDGLTIQVDEALDAVERRELSVRFDRPPPVRADFARGQIVLDFRWSRDDVRYEKVNIQQWPQFELEYSERAPLGEIMDDLSALQNLLTLCADSPGEVESVYLYRSDIPERVLSGDVIPGTMARIELLSAFVESRAGRKESRPEPH
ncbi:hypothetical protein Lfu02_57860 [Longispora fulva]|uniref:ApeA N-terminal domain-containing protein n=1 Tax=Longispora fulva TaxID=619741 RepID=A0A8J7GS52_9ACTN|nr:hypothetical protein [Longispora fulva]MBG6137233.1 hypothetical protein [Longispora fulva]GIG61414.1 hypothetical protein Lfu02_57860 [Longispora fulva]